MNSEKVITKIEETKQNIDYIHNYFVNQCEFLERNYAEHSVKTSKRLSDIKKPNTDKLIEMQTFIKSHMIDDLNKYNNKIIMQDKMIELITLEKSLEQNPDNMLIIMEKLKELMEYMKKKQNGKCKLFNNTKYESKDTNKIR